MDKLELPDLLAIKFNNVPAAASVAPVIAMQNNDSRLLAHAGLCSCGRARDLPFLKTISSPKDFCLLQAINGHAVSVFRINTGWILGLSHD
jgi:hypothetical protein